MFSPTTRCSAILGVLFVCTAWLVAAPNVPAADDIYFNRDIRPILSANCAACHGGVKQAGGVSFVYPDQVLPPEGWIVEPGDPDASSLIERIESDDADLRMPPSDHGPPLAKEEISLLRQWIAQGAKWQQHWAFEQPMATPVPSVSDEAWPRRELDRYILARLDAEGLAPSEDASPRRWLRRVTLDLLGLPPSPEQQRQFVEDVAENGEQAYEQAVDRLLASSHFGERWASVWLDQVRYADSMGLGIDSRRTIWAYRDWVIRALSDDMPYNDFTIKQLAGDLLPNAGPSDLIATACSRLTQTNEEGGTDDEEFRIAAVLDRVNTTWQTWQGITFGCVQCHSHPYEPIEHEDYYRFAAFFNNTADSDLGNDAPTYQAPRKVEDYPRAAELDNQISSIEGQLWQASNELASDDSAWSGLTGLQASTSSATKVVVDSKSDRDEFRTVGTVARNTDITLEAPLPADIEELTAVRITAMPQDLEKAVTDSEWGFVWSHVEAELLTPGSDKARPIAFSDVIGDEPDPVFPPAESLNPKSNNGFSAYSRIHYPRSAVFILTEPIEIASGARLRLRLKHRIYILSAFSLVTRRGCVEVTDERRFTEFAKSEERAEMREQLSNLKSQRKAIPSVSTPIVAERPSDLSRPTHVFERGLFLDKGDQVTAGIPSSLGDLKSSSEVDRLDMARWLVSEENPLAARVAVNRIWARLFGVGIVETEEDFGSSGEPPSHPQLLDYLAIEFQTGLQWSTKKLIKEIVLSRSYRQASTTTPELEEADPSNRLLARGPRFRLSAEMIRDQALEVSGLLNHDLFGPPVQPPIPAGVWQSFDGGDKWPDAERGNPQRYRRSIYTYIKRSIPYPMFASFDQPSREFCTPRRLRSNTPLQALEMLNSEAMLECAEALAGRMNSYSSNTEEALAYGFELCTCREPNDDELTTLRQLYDRKAGEQGFVVAAQLLLNLDEFLMK